MNTEEKYSLIESLLFASDSPVSIEQFYGILPDLDLESVKQCFMAFIEWYNKRPGGIQAVQVAGGWQLVTRPEFSDAVRKLRALKRRFRFSRAALETLAIVAYRQPVTAPEIENIRGVDSGGVLKTLLEKKLVSIIGRKKGPGNPLLYGTTDQFLIAFGLNDLNALPSLKEYNKLIPKGATNLEIPFEIQHESKNKNIEIGENK